MTDEEEILSGEMGDPFLDIDQIRALYKIHKTPGERFGDFMSRATRIRNPKPGQIAAVIDKMFRDAEDEKIPPEEIEELFKPISEERGRELHDKWDLFMETGEWEIDDDE